MPDVMIKADNSKDIQNGRIVVSVTGGSDIKTVNPAINTFVPSGEMISKLEDRFKYHYGGGPSGVEV